LLLLLLLLLLLYHNQNIGDVMAGIGEVCVTHQCPADLVLTLCLYVYLQAVYFEQKRGGSNGDADRKGSSWEERSAAKKAEADALGITEENKHMFEGGVCLSVSLSVCICILLCLCLLNVSHPYVRSDFIDLADVLCKAWSFPIVLCLLFAAQLNMPRLRR
jgi:hypothetical protein